MPGAFDVAKMWQDDQPRPSTANDSRHVVAGQPDDTVNDHQQPPSVPRFPWYY